MSKVLPAVHPAWSGLAKTLVLEMDDITTIILVSLPIPNERIRKDGFSEIGSNVKDADCKIL